ncbi:hypothetical protein LCGC14_0646680 [marine sediment metagenome]|uniref:TRUD domain-containing protein n=1 Tax=marine sediment metagenome TaxID=412755 RepID=A0A0F9R2S1_9ZZZZ
MHDQKRNFYSFETNDQKEIERFVGIEAYCSSKLEGIGGVCKTLFKDFIVKEIDNNGKILDIKDDPPGPSFSKELRDAYTTFNLVKINKDTFQAIRNLRKALKIPYTSIHYSGLKDKRAISVQKVSIRGNYVKELKKLKIHDIFIRNIFPTKRPVKLGGHLGNNFTIIIRNVEDRNSDNQKVKKLLDFLSRFGFPNYFGLQRFGKYRPNSHFVGRLLLEGEYKRAFNEYVLSTYSTEPEASKKAREDLRRDGDLQKAYENFPKHLKYERNMISFLMSNSGDYQGAMNTLSKDLKRLLISSFQSYLFNKMLTMRVKKGFSLFQPIKGDAISILDDNYRNITHIRYIYGGLYDKFLRKALEQNRASIILPIIGKETILDDFPSMKAIFKEVVKIEGIDETIFKKHSVKEGEFKGSVRALTIKPVGLKMMDFTDDDLHPGMKKIKIEFSIQKGSYATMLVRELIK